LFSTSPTKAMSRWPPRADARGHRAARDVVDGHVGHQRLRDVDQDDRHPVAVQRAHLGRPQRQRDDDHPVDPVAAREAPQRRARWSSVSMLKRVRS
jgi:hypothetical protein